MFKEDKFCFMYNRERLATLSAVVEHGSFELAAVRLHITPSAVSQRIKALEVQAGQVLVSRMRPCQATPAGEAFLRLARQISVLEGDVARSISIRSGPTHLPVAVNADSLSHWFIGALTALVDTHDVRLDLHVEDEKHTAGLLRDGTVVAAVTTASIPVQGCSVRLLGAMRYRPVAASGLAQRWFHDREHVEAFVAAPRVDLGPHDQLQTRFVRSVTSQPCTGTAHRVAGADGYHTAVRRGLGWGMFHDGSPGREEVVRVGGTRFLDVPLYWQQWRLRTAVLEELAADSDNLLASRTPVVEHAPSEPAAYRRVIPVSARDPVGGPGARL